MLSHAREIAMSLVSAQRNLPIYDSSMLSITLCALSRSIHSAAGCAAALFHFHLNKVLAALLEFIESKIRDHCLVF